jgi:hypothetical protein
MLGPNTSEPLNANVHVQNARYFYFEIFVLIFSLYHFLIHEIICFSGHIMRQFSVM